VNQPAIEAIMQAVPVPVQIGGGLRDRSSVAELLDLGVQRVILGTVRAASVGSRAVPGVSRANCCRY